MTNDNSVSSKPVSSLSYLCLYNHIYIFQFLYVGLRVKFSRKIKMSYFVSLMVKFFYVSAFLH